MNEKDLVKMIKMADAELLKSLRMIQVAQSNLTDPERLSSLTIQGQSHETEE